MKHRKSKWNKKKYLTNMLYITPIMLFMIVSAIGYWLILDYMSIAYEKELDAKLESQMEQIYE